GASGAGALTGSSAGACCCWCSPSASSASSTCSCRLCDRTGRWSAGLRLLLVLRALPQLLVDLLQLIDDPAVALVAVLPCIELEGRLPDRAITAKDVRVFLLRSEEHTSELQSRRDLVCRLLLEKKKDKRTVIRRTIA